MSEILFYVNGKFVGKSDKKSTSDICVIGNYQGGTQKFANRLDEVRVSRTARSAAWLQAAWLNQASNKVFCTYGPAEQPGK